MFILRSQINKHYLIKLVSSDLVNESYSQSPQMGLFSRFPFIFYIELHELNSKPKNLCTASLKKFIKFKTGGNHNSHKSFNLHLNTFNFVLKFFILLLCSLPKGVTGRIRNVYLLACATELFKLQNNL